MIGMGLLSHIHFNVTDGSEYTLILGSFGASAVLLFAAPQVPFSQPRNVIGGHLISCAIGVASYQLLPLMYAVPVAASFSIMAMMATDTVHPPAGGTTVIAVLGSQRIHDLGFALLGPTGIGACALVGIALLNNVHGAEARQYPKKWF